MLTIPLCGFPSNIRLPPYRPYRGTRFVNLCAIAASYNDFAMLKWAKESGAPLVRGVVCEHAAARGNLEMLQWAVAHGVHLTMSCRHRATEGGHDHVLAWLRNRKFLASLEVRMQPTMEVLGLWAGSCGCHSESKEICREMNQPLHRATLPPPQSARPRVA